MILMEPYLKKPRNYLKSRSTKITNSDGSIAITRPTMLAEENSEKTKTVTIRISSQNEKFAVKKSSTAA